jgi:hypothetical protein
MVPLPVSDPMMVPGPLAAGIGEHDDGHEDLGARHPDSA